MLTRCPVPWGSQVSQLVRYHRCNIFKWLEPLFQICWEAQGPLYANTSGGGFSGGLAFSSCPLGGLIFPPPFPHTGQHLITSFPRDQPQKIGGSHRLCWRFWVLEAGWPIQLLAGPFHCLLSGLLPPPPNWLEKPSFSWLITKSNFLFPLLGPALSRT